MGMDRIWRAGEQHKLVRVKQAGRPLSSHLSAVCAGIRAPSTGKVLQPIWSQLPHLRPPALHRKGTGDWLVPSEALSTASEGQKLFGWKWDQETKAEVEMLHISRGTERRKCWWHLHSSWWIGRCPSLLETSWLHPAASKSRSLLLHLSTPWWNRGRKKLKRREWN